MPCKKCKQSGHNSRTCSVVNATVNANVDANVNVNVDANVDANANVDLDANANVETNSVALENIPIPKSDEIDKRYFCYILGQTRQLNSGTGRTYNGYTVNLNRRLRQHNGEIKGGAFATKGIGPWEFIAVMTCDTWNNVRAMQVEWLIRYPTRKKPRPTCYAGAKGRISSLVEVCKRLGDDSVRLYIHPMFYDYAKTLGLSPPISANLFSDGFI
jgi:predicted GIY-YIG superfamily endonuclease